MIIEPYRTKIQPGINEEVFDAKVTFRFIKDFTFDGEAHRDIFVKKLERLKKDDFGLIRIPKFTYELIGNLKLRQEVEYIKGFPIGSSKQPYISVIFKEIVLRPDPWTFSDLNAMNFIVEKTTRRIYAIDFQSYCYWPHMESRLENWNKWHTKQLKMFESIVTDLKKGEEWEHHI